MLQTVPKSINPVSSVTNSQKVHNSVDPHEGESLPNESHVNNVTNFQYIRILGQSQEEDSLQNNYVASIVRNSLISDNIEQAQYENSLQPAITTVKPVENLFPTNNSQGSQGEKNIQNSNKKNIKNKNPKESKKASKSTIILANIRGLIPGTRRDKVQFISALASESDSEIILLTETHLEKRINDCEVSFPGWNLLRADRHNETEGRDHDIFQ